MTILVAALLGLVICSFLNVVIVRLPLEESIVTPRSHCRQCDSRITWRDNIPVVSFVMLGGRCRICTAPISKRYPLVELLTGVLFGLIAAQDLPPAHLALEMAIASAMIVITFIDIDHFLILDRITYPSIAASPFLALAVGHITVADSLIGILAGGGGLWAFAWTYEKVRHREGMGFGDVKLLAMIGGLLGWEATLFSLFAGAIVGSFYGLATMLVGGRKFDLELPFGPFLAFGSLVYMFAGPHLIELWLDRPPLF